MRTMAAGEFKAKCLAVMDEVNETGEPIQITKRGKVVACLTPPKEVASRKLTVNSISARLRDLATIAGDPDEWIAPIVPEGEWEHTKPDWGRFPAE
jgi:prevent-host-death family protein